jgi:hypothetical protein
MGLILLIPLIVIFIWSLRATMTQIAAGRSPLSWRGYWSDQTPWEEFKGWGRRGFPINVRVVDSGSDVENYITPEARPDMSDAPPTPFVLNMVAFEDALAREIER